MIFLAKLIGILVVIMGIICVVSPKTTKQMIDFWKEGKRLYGAALLRLLFGAILLFAAGECRIPGWVIFFGVMFLLGGVLVFSLGLERSRKILDWYNQKAETVLRFYAVIAIIIGGLILYSI